MDLVDIEPEKVSSKNRPTFVYKSGGNRLYKVSLASETEKESLQSHEKIRETMQDRLRIKEAADLPSLCQIIERQNTRCDDMTFVYYEDQSKKELPLYHDL